MQIKRGNRELSAEKKCGGSSDDSESWKVV